MTLPTSCVPPESIFSFAGGLKGVQVNPGSGNYSETSVDFKCQFRNSITSFTALDALEVPGFLIC